MELKFFLVIAYIIVMIGSALLGESKKVTPGTGKFFNTLAIIMFAVLAVGGAYWFFSTPASHN